MPDSRDCQGAGSSERPEKQLRRDDPFRCQDQGCHARSLAVAAIREPSLDIVVVTVKTDGFLLLLLLSIILQLRLLPKRTPERLNRQKQQL